MIEPTIISNILFKLNPTRTVHQPDNEFRIDIIIGMSAPPIVRTKKKPNERLSVVKI